MSIQEELAKKVGADGFNTYLTRMKDSAHFSTKQNIPSIIRANNCTRILDVGCADGAFTEMIAFANPQATVHGIDINPECVVAAERRCKLDGKSLTFNCEELAEVQGRFDCIVFSSVMHEISSYCGDEAKRYTGVPIYEAIKEACKHLTPGGIIVIRDWVDCIEGHLLRVKFKSLQYSAMFKRFQEEFPAIDLCSVSGMQLVYEDDETPDGWKVHQKLLMEYLMVATWGEQSWAREINERKFICTKNNWYDMAETAGLTVIGWLQTNEEYPIYCERIAEVKLLDSRWRMPDTTFVMVCRKD